VAGCKFSRLMFAITPKIIIRAFAKLFNDSINQSIC
jgi:hypothetical protein